MRDQDLLQHLEIVEKELFSMVPVSAVTFGLSCIERHWLVLVRALASGSRRDMLAEARRAVNESWVSIEGKSTEGVLSLARVGDVLLNSFSGGSPDAAAVQAIAVRWADFAEAVGEHDFAYAHHLAAANIDLIQLCDADYESASLDNALQVELAHQLRDIQLLKGDGAQAVKQIEHSSRNVDLLAGMWIAE